MKSDSMAKFITAVKNAGINVWSAVTAPMVHWYHNPDQNQLIWHDGGDYIATARFNRQNEGPGKISIGYANLDDIHELRTSGGVKEIKSVLEELGMTVTDDDVKILVRITGAERQIIPPTGNYNFKDFIYLSEAQLERLTPEEREQYENDKAEWEEYLKEKEKSIPGPLQVTLGYPY